MPEGPDNNTKLLSPGEPTPYRVINPLAETPTLLVCDHASSRFPQALGDMGLDPFARRCHLAIDIGAGEEQQERPTWSLEALPERSSHAGAASMRPRWRG